MTLHDRQDLVEMLRTRTRRASLVDTEQSRNVICYKCPYCVKGRFYAGEWEEAKRHIAENHMNKERKKKNGIRTRRRRSSSFSDLLLDDSTIGYPEEEEIATDLA